MQAAQRKVVYYELVENLHSRKKKRLTNHLVFQFPSHRFYTLPAYELEKTKNATCLWQIAARRRAKLAEEQDSSTQLRFNQISQ